MLAGPTAPLLRRAGSLFRSEGIVMRSHLAYRLKRLERRVLARLTLAVPRLRPLMATAQPLVKIEYRGAAQSTAVIIFLPGIDDLAEDFERRGVIDDMRRQGVAIDAVAVDAHYGYYAEEVIFERMTDDVIAWARDAGYRRIWLAGISLGGFGAALYAAHHSSHVDGLILLAPYLGDDALIEEIVQAGGVHRWHPGHVGAGDYPRFLWAWFKRHVGRHGKQLPIFIGYGTRDKFARANALLAEHLADDRKFAIAGGHDWRTWKKIWRLMLKNWKAHA